MIEKTYDTCWAVDASAMVTETIKVFLDRQVWLDSEFFGPDQVAFARGVDAKHDKLSQLEKGDEAQCRSRSLYAFGSRKYDLCITLPRFSSFYSIAKTSQNEQSKATSDSILESSAGASPPTIVRHLF